MRELPIEVVDLDRALKARVELVIIVRLNTILGRMRNKMHEEGKQCDNRADRRAFERMTEMLDSLLDEVNQ
jgi:hypothetical protein